LEHITTLSGYIYIYLIQVLYAPLCLSDKLNVINWRVLLHLIKPYKQKQRRTQSDSDFY